MKKMIHYALVVVSMCVMSSITLSAQENNQQKLPIHVVSVPAMGGAHPRSISDFGLVALSDEATYAEYHDSCVSDFGGRRCIKNFLTQFNKDPRVQEDGTVQLQLVGCSQGAITILRSLPHMKKRDRKRITRIVLEGTTCAPHETVDHFALQRIPCLFLLPFSRAWGPLVAATCCCCVCYKPCGDKNYNKCVEKIGKSIDPATTVVMMHGLYDSQAPAYGAFSLYQQLKQHHPKIFFVAAQSGQMAYQHINMLKYCKPDERLDMLEKIATIYERSGVPLSSTLKEGIAVQEDGVSIEILRNRSESEELSVSQKAYTSFSNEDEDDDLIDALESQKRFARRARCIRNFVDVTTIAGGIWYWFFHKNN